MLVANPGHTPYALAKPICSSRASLKAGPSSVSTSKSIATTSIYAASTSTATVSSSSLVTPTKCGILQSFTVKLNRGTEYIKQTVQNALLSKIPHNLNIGKELYTIAPTSTHRAPSRSTNSVDSLKAELCHFKPIRTVPKTRTESSDLKTPKPRKIVRTYSDIENFPSPMPCPIPENLASPSQYSAFFPMISPSKLISQKEESPQEQKNRRSGTSSSGKSTNADSSKSTPVKPRKDTVKPKRLYKQTANNGSPALEAEPAKKKVFEDNNQKRKRLKGNKNGQIAPAETVVQNKHNIRRRNDSESTNKTEVPKRMTRYDILEKQKQMDYEFAKKLQAELDGKWLRTNNHRTRYNNSKKNSINSEDMNLNCTGSASSNKSNDNSDSGDRHFNCKNTNNKTETIGKPTKQTTKRERKTNNNVAKDVLEKPMKKSNLIDTKTTVNDNILNYNLRRSTRKRAQC